MANVRVMKRGNVYQYQFEIASDNETRKYKNRVDLKQKQRLLKRDI